MASAYDHRQQTERFAILKLLVEAGPQTVSGLTANAPSSTLRLKKLREVCIEGQVERDGDLYVATKAGCLAYERMKVK